MPRDPGRGVLETKVNLEPKTFCAWGVTPHPPGTCLVGTYDQVARCRGP